MEILLLAATYQEIAPFVERFGANRHIADPINIGTHRVHLLISGVGMTATAYALGKAFTQNNFDLALNVGIAGSFSRNIKIGQLVEVREDILAELGAEDDEEFISLEQMGLGDVIFYGTDQLKLDTDIRTVTGITVNTVHGNEDSILRISQRLNPTIESMEGAAFFYACQQAKVPALQLRTISNYVEKRNRDNWNLPLAVKNLNDWLIENLARL
ncbi:futalosine hydrolase [Pelobium manganitolerans]|uniref:futalosine hydrolase n=1 Tax=Pelobium manganitolerans TaxID=1842495 RepID=UPI003FA344C9